MRRRDFISSMLLCAATVTWPVAGKTQSADQMRRIGVLMAYAASDQEAVDRVKVFAKALQNLGWTDGSNIRIEYRWAGGKAELFTAYAAELAQLKCDAILSATTPVLAALLKQTRSIPIVFLSVSDPVGDGFIKSLAHPGGNATGFINIESGMAGKWVELLKEVVPGLARAAMIFNPKTAPGGGSYFMGPFKAAASSLAVEPIAVSVSDRAELENAVVTQSHEPHVGLIVPPDSFTVNNRDLIISLAASHNMPVIYPYSYMAKEGGLMSYGIDLQDMYERAATDVDRILKGEKPQDLPVEAPTKFELVINHKTAKDLGLAIPQTLLATADEVIE
jgi:putative tryptophan/tyrosine transport system substrate-binding protein